MQRRLLNGESAWQQGIDAYDDTHELERSTLRLLLTTELEARRHT